MTTTQTMIDEGEIATVVGDRADVWVFGYGSLMWNPGFSPTETRPALARGRHRRFCVASTVYRGTPERPGLLLGLDRGGSCRGLALRVPRESRSEVLLALWRREMNGRVYRPAMIPVTLTDDGSRVEALAFIADRAHPHHVDHMDEEARAARVFSATGERGGNLEYVLETARALEALGVRDDAVTRLARALARLRRERNETR